MRPELVEHLDPALNLCPASLVSYRDDQGHVLEGTLHAQGGSWYPILDGVPCFLKGALRPDLSAFAHRHGLTDVRACPAPPVRPEHQQEQAKTNVSFSDKWRRFKTYGIDPRHQPFLRGWYCKKLGLTDEAALSAFYKNRRRILEVGPGSGFNTRYMAENTQGTVFAADISDAAFTTFQNTRHLPNCHVVQADVFDLPFPDGHFDFIIADGVLHHTPNTRTAVESLFRKLAPGGQFFFYVYRSMGAARQFCDDYIRQHFMPLATEECYQACEGLTELGRELSRVGTKITLEKGVPVLGIPPGTHDVQRLFYYNFVKCFWNEAFDFETNNMVNFDWYHPHNAWQHTEEEVVGWLGDLGVQQFSFQNANPNGLSVLLRKAA